MKILNGCAALAAATVLLSGCNSEGSLPRADGVPQSDGEKQSYALGQNMGRNLAAAKIEIDNSYFNAGFYDALDGEARMTQEDMQLALQALQQATEERHRAEQQAVASGNQQHAETFFSENGQAEGVVTLESGLQYKVLVAGEGVMPSASDTVKVHYEGRLLDGTVFDSSLERGPATFPVNGVIAGWTEALQLMAVGSKWQLFIPSALAYGEMGAGGIIAPNSALTFDVELLAIEAP